MFLYSLAVFSIRLTIHTYVHKYKFLHYSKISKLPRAYDRIIELRMPF